MIDVYIPQKIKTIFSLSLLVFFINARSQTYCPTYYFNGNSSGDYISLVKIPSTTLNSISLADFGAYKLFPAFGSTTATLKRGNSIPYTLTVAGGATTKCYIYAWGDWNKNGIFEDSEYIGASPNAGNSTTVNFAYGISIPQSAAIGITRLRFRTSDGDYPQNAYYPCNRNFSNYGETEDYTITITCQFTNLPTVGFTFTDSIFVKSPTTLINSNTSFLESNKWYVNNVYDTNSTNLNHTFQTTGTYSICMKSINCIGSDSNCFPVTVYNPTQPPIAAFSSNKDTIEAGLMLSLKDLSGKGPYYWHWSVTPNASATFLNGTSATSQNPILSFSQPGLYQVCLWDSNAVGRSSTVCKNIYVLPNNRLCIYPFETNLASGCFTDDGGIAGNYSANGICNFLINACADTVHLKFSQFNLSANSFLRIYDGKNNLAPPLFTGSGFTGTTLPGGTAGLTASSGKMYLEFQKGTTAPGFTASWTTAPTIQPPPSGRIDGPDTVDDCGGIFIVTYVSKIPGFSYEDATYFWDFDYMPFNGPSYPNKGYYSVAAAYGNTGTYILKLEIQSCKGNEIIFDTITVIHPFSQPDTKFRIDPNTAVVNDSITVTEITKIQPFWRTWTINGPGGFNLTSVSTFSRSFKFKLPSPGTYSIELWDSNCVGSKKLIKYITPYCVPVVTNLNSDFSIKRFELNLIDKLTYDSTNILNVINTNPVVGTVTYRDNTQTKEAVAKLGDSISFKIERHSAFNSADFKVWIDYDHDAIFQNSELVASSASVSGNYFTGSFTIPLSAKTNYTRIRIGTNAAGFSNTPCGVNTYGDFNDFQLKLLPSINFPNNNDTVYVEVGRVFNDPGIIVSGAATITHSGKPFGSIVTTFPSLSVHTITVTDSALNTITRNLFVKATKDITKPVITKNGADTVYVEGGNSYAELGATATDFYFGSITSSIITTSSVNLSKLGTNFVRYNVNDAAGNAADAVVRCVIVIDTKAPTITLIDKDTVIINVKTLTVVPDPGYTYYDNFYPSSSIILKVDYTNVLLNKIGRYPVRYYISDSSGNMDSSKVRVFDVRDTSAPVITLIGAQSLNWSRGKPYTDPGSIVTDNYDTNLLCIPDISDVNINYLGYYHVTFNIKDSSGNSALTVNRAVRIWDNGIEDKISNDLFSIYPNPNNGKLNINLNFEKPSTASLYVYNSNGAMVYSKDNFNAIDNKFLVDLSKEASGLYFIKVMNGKQVVTKIFTIQK